MAENWRRAEGSPPYPYWRDAATGETQKFFYFWHCCMEKGNREGNGAEAGEHR
nr:MAG TPA: hypothetical protein [Caudoviricetes sp.]